MKDEKPFLFIGSSQEARTDKIIDAFVTALSEEANCVPWHQVREFSQKGSGNTLDALCAAANNYDFGLFILTNDDLVTSRKTESPAPRDNVIFEYGLFLSAIGPQRVFAFVEEGCSLKTPSDLGGIFMPRFNCDRTDSQTLLSSVNTATRETSTTIREHGFRKVDLQIAHQWWFDTKEKIFKVDLSAAKLQRASSTIGKWSICIAARVSDSRSNFEDDANVVYSDLRKLPSELSNNLSFEIPASKFEGKLTSGATIEARIVLVPEKIKTVDAGTTLSKLVRARGRNVEPVSLSVGKIKV